MTILRVDDETAAVIEAKATQQGLSVAEYLRRLTTPEHPTAEATEDLEAEIDELSFRGPSLPEDFSRADIYERRVG